MRIARRITRGAHRHPDGIRARMRSLLIDRHGWWDWGHRLMILTGSDHGGNWGNPEPPTWWYRAVPGKPMWRTGYPRHRFEIITDYWRFREIYEPLREDARYEWKAFAMNQDRELVLGKQYWGGPFYGLRRDEQRLLGRYLRMCRRHDWYGIRSWLYAQGLHAAVDHRRPWRCNASPPQGTGGYSHWHCHEPRRHAGLHRCNNYVWGEINGEQIGAHYAPQDSFA